MQYTWYNQHVYFTTIHLHKLPPQLETDDWAHQKLSTWLDQLDQIYLIQLLLTDYLFNLSWVQ